MRWVWGVLLLCAARGAAAREVANARNPVPAGKADTGRTIDASALSKPPKLVKLAKVEYPAQAAGKSGVLTVSLLIDLDEKGGVSGASVLEPKTNTGLGFEDAAVAAAYDLEFEPAEIEGKPVPVQIVYKFKFIPPEPAPIATATAPPPPATPRPRLVENFTGLLLERGTRTPMAGVVVTVYRDLDGKPVGFDDRTDASGHFHFFNLELGAWNVLAEPASYLPFRTSEEIKAGLLTSATYYVERASYNPFDKLVTAPRERKEVSRTVIDPALIDKVPGAMGDPLAVVQDFAGVARAPTGSGKLVIRGSAPMDSQIFVDGIRVPVVYHFLGLRSVLPVGMIDNLEFYPGNFSPYYGRAIGGVVDVSVKKLKPPKLGGYFDVNLLDAGFYVETPIGDKAAVAVAARRSYADAFLKAVLPKNNIADLTVPRYYDYQLLASYRPTPAHDLRFFFFGSDDRFAMISSNPASVGTEISSNDTSLATNFNRGLLTYRYVPREGFDNTLRLSLGRDKVDATLFQFYERFTIDTIQARDTVHYQWTKKLALNAGLDLMNVRINGSASGPLPTRDGQEESSVDPSRVQNTTLSGANDFLPGAFAELELQPTPKLLILPGVRLDYFSDISQFTAAPRLTMRYQLRKGLTLKGGVGLFYQEPATDQIDRNFGNPALKAERAIHYSAGVEWQPREHLLVDVTGFYKDLGSMVSPTAATVERDGVVTDLRYDNRGVGRAYGGELVARYESSRLTAWLAYTLSRSERRDSGSSTYRLFNYDQTHILTAFGTYRLPGNWEIGSRFRLVSGSPTTPIVGSVYSAIADRYYPVFGSKYSDRMPLFAQLDLRVDKRWVFNRWMLDTYIDVQNVFNRANPEAIQYNFNFTKEQVRQGLPIYPIFGIRGEF
jgi:TonB family protein